MVKVGINYRFNWGGYGYGSGYGSGPGYGYRLVASPGSSRRRPLGGQIMKTLNVAQLLAAAQKVSGRSGPKTGLSAPSWS